MITRTLGDDGAASDAGEAPPPARIAHRYEILGLVGIGGMGSVYRVRDLELDEIVALKFLRGHHSATAQERFRNEAKLARRVSHFNVARTFDIGQHDGERFLTMEFVDGEPLGRILEREGALAIARTADVVRQLCAGLEAAHAAGVVHRDLKPDNVLVEKTGRVVISDFGIARTGDDRLPTPDAAIVGTASYMSPEQAEGLPTDARSDIYALGALIYEMLTGERAWTGEAFREVAMRRLHAPPPDPRALRPDVPARIADVALRCMQRRKEDRFAHAADVGAAFDAALSALSVLKSAQFEAELPRPLPARAFRVAPAPGGSATTVAVLPFRNQGPREDDFLVDELTDELIDSLSMMGALRVRPRRLVERHDTRELAELGTALDVQVVVEGTLRRTEKSVRVSARAIAIAEGIQIWAQRFERDAHELADVSHDVARAAASAFASGIAPNPSRSPPKVDAIGAELYLRARRELRRAWGGMGDLDLAVELFRQAATRSPDDPAALSGFAMARARRYNYHGGGERELDAIRELAERTIALAPHLGEPWQTLATLTYVTSDWPEAVRALRRALHLAPGLLRAHEMLAHIEIEVGRTLEGLFRFETVLALDPTSPGARREAIRAYAIRGQWDRVDALEAFPPEEGPDALMRRLTAARLDLYRGTPRAELVGEGGDTSPHLILARALGLAIRGLPAPPSFEDSFRARIAASAPGSRLRPLLWQIHVEWSLAAKRPMAVALDAVRCAVESGLYDRTWLESCPVLAPLRSEPSWPEIVAPVSARAERVIAALDEELAE
jgi:serine/threonine-protein kinase